MAVMYQHLYNDMIRKHNEINAKLERINSITSQKIERMNNGMKTVYYAIEVIGKKFYIKKVIGNCTYPVNFEAYKTETAAKQAAKEMGIQIKYTGDLWKIINK